MSKVKINCPQCKQEVVLEKEAITQAKGRIACPHCAHVFHLVKKSKSKAATAATPLPNDGNQVQTGTAYNEPKVEDANDIAAIFKNLPNINDNTDAPKANKKHASNARKADKAPQSQVLNRIEYRIPKAPFKNPQFNEVGSKINDAFAFNLLDRDGIENQIPQVAIKPSMANLPIPAARNGEQQNNITIHTDSLVFTLVGEGQNPMGNLMQPQILPGAAVANPAPPIAVSNEMNWTIATIAALVVLILQLFYLIMMLI